MFKLCNPIKLKSDSDFLLFNYEYRNNNIKLFLSNKYGRKKMCKKIIISSFIFSALFVGFVGCEKADYKHPRHRAAG